MILRLRDREEGDRAALRKEEEGREEGKDNINNNSIVMSRKRMKMKGFILQQGAEVKLDPKLNISMIEIQIEEEEMSQEAQDNNNNMIMMAMS